MAERTVEVFNTLFYQTQVTLQGESYRFEPREVKHLPIGAIDDESFARNEHLIIISYSPQPVETMAAEVFQPEPVVVEEVVEQPKRKRGSKEQK